MKAYMCVVLYLKASTFNIYFPEQIDLRGSHIHEISSSTTPCKI